MRYLKNPTLEVNIQHYQRDVYGDGVLTNFEGMKTIYLLDNGEIIESAEYTKEEELNEFILNVYAKYNFPDKFMKTLRSFTASAKNAQTSK